MEKQIRRRGVDRPEVLAAMTAVPRERFVPKNLEGFAYDDRPLPLDHGQTISQPFIVALMTATARPGPGDRVLEIGTGSGYQSAILASCAKEVYTIEIVPELARRARAVLEELGFGNIEYRVGDGAEGWPDRAPFDAVVVTAAPRAVPPRLVEQLAVGGRLVVPVGESRQELRLVVRTDRGTETSSIAPVRFVPLTGYNTPFS